jgi:hypothetical protein
MSAFHPRPVWELLRQNNLFRDHELHPPAQQARSGHSQPARRAGTAGNGRLANHVTRKIFVYFSLDTEQSLSESHEFSTPQPGTPTRSKDSTSGWLLSGSLLPRRTLGGVRVEGVHC